MLRRVERALGSCAMIAFALPRVGTMKPQTIRGQWQAVVVVEMFAFESNADQKPARAEDQSTVMVKLCHWANGGWHAVVGTR
jgi:hypothetical protein